MLSTKRRLIELILNLHSNLDDRITNICAGRKWGELTNDEKLMVQELGDYRDYMEEEMSKHNEFEDYIHEINRTA